MGAPNNPTPSANIKDVVRVFATFVKGPRIGAFLLIIDVRSFDRDSSLRESVGTNEHRRGNLLVVQ